jgi:hypothetical protein
MLSEGESNVGLVLEKRSEYMLHTFYTSQDIIMYMETNSPNFFESSCILIYYERGSLSNKIYEPLI